MEYSEVVMNLGDLEKAGPNVSQIGHQAHETI